MLHRTNGVGEDFKLLGLTFDVQLRMERRVSILAREAGWRLQFVLRSRKFFHEKQIVNLYTSQVLSYVESSTPRYYHTASTILRPLDRASRIKHHRRACLGAIQAGTAVLRQIACIFCLEPKPHTTICTLLLRKISLTPLSSPWQLCSVLNLPTPRIACMM